MKKAEETRKALEQSFNCKQINVSELDTPLLVVLDYSPSDNQRPLLSIAFDVLGRPRCWMTVSKVRDIDGKSPNRHEDYREFTYEGRRFHPYSIHAFPLSIFTDVEEFTFACRLLYAHADWSD